MAAGAGAGGGGQSVARRNTGWAGGAGPRRCGWRQTGGYTGRNCTAQFQHRHHGNEECHEELTEKSIE